MTILQRVPPPALWLIPIGVATRRLLATLAAHLCLVKLDHAAQQTITFVLHHATDALTEEPSCLLSNAEMLSQLDRETPLPDAAIR